MSGKLTRCRQSMTSIRCQSTEERNDSEMDMATSICSRSLSTKFLHDMRKTSPRLSPRVTLTKLKQVQLPVEQKVQMSSFITKINNLKAQQTTQTSRESEISIFRNQLKMASDAHRRQINNKVESIAIESRDDISSPDIDDKLSVKVKPSDKLSFASLIAKTKKHNQVELSQRINFLDKFKVVKPRVLSNEEFKIVFGKRLKKLKQDTKIENNLNKCPKEITSMNKKGFSEVVLAPSPKYSPRILSMASPRRVGQSKKTLVLIDLLVKD